jgi:DNA-directed RNA polymerase sigma subunit (sigma70/sigma32)
VDFAENKSDGQPNISYHIEDDYNPYDGINKKLLNKMIEATIKSVKQRRALKLTFGIDCEPMTLKEAGVEMGLTYEGVRQLRIKGLTYLQENKDLFKTLLD